MGRLGRSRWMSSCRSLIPLGTPDLPLDRLFQRVRLPPPHPPPADQITESMLGTGRSSEMGSLARIQHARVGAAGREDRVDLVEGGQPTADQRGNAGFV